MSIHGRGLLTTDLKFKTLVSCLCIHTNTNELIFQVGKPSEEQIDKKRNFKWEQSSSGNHCIHVKSPNAVSLPYHFYRKNILYSYPMNS